MRTTFIHLRRAKDGFKNLRPTTFNTFRIKNCNIFFNPNYTIGVNFINILRAAFVPIYLPKKLQSHAVTREKLRKALLYKKAGVKC